jgi:hypothetical protein
MTGIINGAFLAALESILEQLLPRDDDEGINDHERAANDLVREWFENGKAETKSQHCCAN